MSEQRFYAETMSHDLFSTKFAREGCTDPLASTDYKEPPIVAYAVENHPNDSRVKIDPDGIVQTLSARIGTGGGNAPIVLLGVTPQSCCWAVDSHPMDSRIRIVEGVCPSITAKLAKLASDGPLILIRRKT